MAVASLFLQLVLCLLACQSNEAVPRRSPAVRGQRPNYADCPIGPPIDKGTINSDGSLPECSGMAYSRQQDGVIWTFNDSGGENKIFAISEQGDRLQSVELRDISNNDWEDIAIAVEGGVSYIYLADTGNNCECRSDLRIHKFPEPVVLLEDIQIDSNDIETIKVSYPDRNYDCEGMVVDPDTLDIILFTKHSTSDVFRVPSGSGGEVRELELVGLLNHRDVTGADISPSGDILALACYDDGWSYSKPDGQTWVEYLSTDPEPTCELQLASENQREAITVTETAYWTVSEGSSPLYYYARYD